MYPVYNNNNNNNKWVQFLQCLRGLMSKLRYEMSYTEVFRGFI